MTRATKHHVHLPRVLDDHRVTLYRRTDIGESHWFMRVYIRDEGRYFRKSLRTHNQKEAEKLAQHELIRLLARKESGQLALSISIAKLVKKYLKELDTQLAHDQMRPATYKNACRRIDRCREFLASKLKAGLESKLSAFDGSIFHEYLEWRWALNKIRRDVVKQELQTIRQMFVWAQNQRPPLCSEKAIPDWDFKVEDEKAKRKAIKIHDCAAVLFHAYIWWQERREDNTGAMRGTSKQAYYRKLMFYVLMVMNSSGMRTGEVLNLKRRDVSEPDSKHFCDVTIHHENTKRKKTREIAVSVPLSGYAGQRRDTNYLVEWKTKHAPHKEDDAYVFSTLEDGHEHVENAFYKTYGQFREYLKQWKLGHVQAYHQRHAFISDRLRAGISQSNIAVHCGTSPRMIDQTYSHITGPEASKQIAKGRLIYGEGVDFSVEET